MRVRSNLKAILDEKEISIRKAARDTDLLFGSVRKMYNDELERFPRDLIGKLCEYLDVTPNDLFILEEPGE